MSNKEIIAKIKAEIEGRIRIQEYWVGKTFPGTELAFAVKEELKQLLSFLDTLESEKPREGLEEEINRYLREECSDDDEPSISEIAHYFYDIGCTHTAEKYDEIEYNRQREEESVPKDLEEAATITLDEAEGVADEYTDFLAKGLIENQPRPIGGKWFIEYARKRFIAGAKWQKEQDEKEEADLFTIVALDAAQRAKEQMMKDAVDVEVESFTDMQSPEVTIPLNPTMFKVGDKIRVIIVKE